MTIYEIDKAIQEMVEGGIDPETGELLLDTAALEALQMERDSKVENLALAIKNMAAEAKAIKAEEEALAARRKAIDAKADRAKKYLDFVLAGEKFSSAKVAVSYRKSTRLQIKDGFLEWAAAHAPDFLRYKDPEPDKTAITNAIKAGRQIDGAELVESMNMSIK